MKKLKYTYRLRKIVVQPTTLCNLNCSYCYLAGRDRSLKMDIQTAENVAKYVNDSDEEISLIWHGGEPLTAGISALESLISPFNYAPNLKHSIQTNGTLINDAWCKFFKQHNFNIGISIDGNELLNRNRIDWANNLTFEKTLKGIGFLKKNNLKFSAIAVITNSTADHVDEFYDFFSRLGCVSVGVNIEQSEGANRGSNGVPGSVVRGFWDQLFLKWQNNPAVGIREFDQSLSWMLLNSHPIQTREIDIFPTIAYNGDVIFLSPELLGADADSNYNFVCGNVNTQSLKEIIDKFMASTILDDYKKGIDQCFKSCPYFSFCGGGDASNKFYENNNLNSTETAFCRNTKKHLVDSVLNSL